MLPSSLLPLPLSARRRARGVLQCIVALTLVASTGAALAHGDVTPQVVDTTSLPQLGETWRSENPYRGSAEAVRIGASGYNQNCARCHGLEAISGGIAPDLRKLGDDCQDLAQAAKKTACFVEIDQYFATSVRRGKTLNGAYKMPPFDGVLTQEAVWAIKSYLETRRAAR